MASEGEPLVHTIDRTPEYEDFMTRLKAYHAQRGTTLDPEPKVSNINLDLLKTFKLIVSNGGYDKVTEEKLLWRKMREQLAIPTTNAPSTAYQLKEKYYKNLAAFEISTVHGKEPPPKDILEDVTAKGGALLTRTRENYFRGKHDAMGGDSAASGDDAAATPSRERPTADTTPTGSSIRASRGLREAPPQRVIFQPETGPSRPSRQASATHQSPHQAAATHAQPTPNPQMAGHHANTPGHNPPGAQNPGQMLHTPVPFSAHGRAPRGPSESFTPQDPDNISSGVESYVPPSLRPIQGIPLRPVDTPSNNPAEFARRRQLARQPPAPRLPDVPPGVFLTPSIYTRCLMGLRSTIPEEQAYALHHLVKISFERGDKFRFEQFPGLAEGLAEKMLEVGALFYEVDWVISWYPPVHGNLGPYTLDGEDGTPDILERIESLKLKTRSDSVQSEDFTDKLQCIIEAALTMRNMVTMVENAHFLSKFAPVRDLICIILRLPAYDSLSELKHLMVEITESLTPYLSLDSADPLYQVLMANIDSDDRGMILTCLRALTRISLNSEETNKLDKVPPKILQRIVEWLYLNDDELMDACLDFLYQYTAVVSNIDSLLRNISTEPLVAHLVRLLSHGARRVQREIVRSPEQRLPPPEEPCPIPDDLLKDLLKVNEPERCQEWVKCLFEADSGSFVTQITAWQAYQNAFNASLKAIGQSLITPADFIRNSTTVYKESKAEVLTTGEMQQKFIIQGIRARMYPVGLDGKEFRRCLWDSVKPGEKCGLFFRNPKDMSTHVAAVHLGVAKNPDGRFPNVTKPFRCHWGDCTRFSTPQEEKFFVFARHIMTHTARTFPPEKPATSMPQDGKRRVPWLRPAQTMSMTYLETPAIRDERNPAAPPRPGGIPFSAALILRNIARNAPKTQAEESRLRRGETDGYNEVLFRNMRPRLFELLAQNQLLGEYISSILDLVSRDRDA